MDEEFEKLALENFARNECSRAALAERIFRPCDALGRIVFGEVALCGGESGAEKTSRSSRRLAVSRGDLSAAGQRTRLIRRSQTAATAAAPIYQSRWDNFLPCGT